MDFSSDTSAPAHPAVLEALLGVNSGTMPSYGNDEVTGRVRGLLADTLETDNFEYWICASGTASNALALSVMCPPTGAVLCHAGAHINVDERGAPEFFTGGGKLQLLSGPKGQIAEGDLRVALERINHDFVHETPAHVLSLTNLTENGCAYSAEQIAHYAALAHEKSVLVHLDGARLANALVSTGSSAAEMTWKAGVDVLCLGLTKTGAIGCEIIVLFGDQREKFPELKARAKRSGHMPPKMRYLAAQAQALLQDGLWLDLALNANAVASRLGQGIEAAGGSLAFPVEGNEVFAQLNEDQVFRLREAGAMFYPWPGGSQRFVTNWATTDEEVDAFLSILGGKA